MPEMVEVFCEECGESLGYQPAGDEMARVAVAAGLWRHAGCPVRIARGLGLSRHDYEHAWGIATVAIAGTLPDFPNGYLDTSEEAADMRTLRSRMAARCALESLALIGFRMSREAKE